MFGLVQLLDFHGVPFLVVSAALFDLLHLRIHPGHVHGIALGLCAGIKHDQLDGHRKEHNRPAVRTGDQIHQIQQQRKRPHNESHQN